MRLTNLLWLFADYRDLVTAVAERDRIIQDLETQLRSRPAGSMEDLIRTFQNETLSEQPFPDGKIPDNMWLTPVDDR